MWIIFELKNIKKNNKESIHNLTLYFQLSKVISPKDDLATEMKTIKKKSREKIEEAERQEEEEATMEVADDGTVPMPPDTLDGQGTETVVTFREPEEEAEPEEVEEDPVKRLKKKKIEEEGIHSNYFTIFCKKNYSMRFAQC